MNYRRWIKIKRVNKSATIKKQQIKDRPVTIQDKNLITYGNGLFTNVNFLTNHAELDTCGNDKIWETASYGDTGADLTGRIDNKPSITKGGHTVLVSDVLCVRTHAYSHIHKLHINTPGCNAWVNIEVK